MYKKYCTVRCRIIFSKKEQERSKKSFLNCRYIGTARMRIKRCHQVDEDDVQIVYESPADEECQFIEVVNPPSGQSSKPSGSRTSVITGRKRSAVSPLPVPGESAAFKKPALEAGNFEQPFLVQPTTSQHSSESTFQNFWLQPSNSEQTGSAEQLPLESEIDSHHSVINALTTVSILMANRKEIQNQLENGNQGCWADSSTSSTMNLIMPNIHAIEESNNVVTDNINLQSFINQQSEMFEQGTREQAISMTTASNIGGVRDNIESNVALVNQPLIVFEQNSQETELQTMNMITEPNLHVIQEGINVTSDDTRSEALMNQQQETFEENNSQETQQQGMSTTQTNANPIPENIEIASASNNSSEALTNEVLTEFPLRDEQPRALEQNSDANEPQIITMIVHSNPQENTASCIGYFRAIPYQQQPEPRNVQPTQPQTVNATNIHTVQESFVTNDTTQLRTFEISDPQRPMVASASECNTAAIQGENSTNLNVLTSQISQVTVPLDLTQTDDLLLPTLCQRLVIDGSFLKKTSQHFVWKGSIEYRKKQSASLTLGHLECNIYGLKTLSGNMNVNADLWPRQLNLILLPSHYLLEHDLNKDLKNINRHATVYFEPRKSAMLLSHMISGWMGYIPFPAPCHSDIMIVLYIPQKSSCMGFIINNESGFILKLLDVCRNCDLKQLQECLPSGSRQALIPPQPTSLPLPAHQQPTSSQLTHQHLPLSSLQQATSSQLSHQHFPLTSHQQPGFSLPSQHPISSLEPNMPTVVTSFPSHIQRSTSHLSTSLPQSSQPLIQPSAVLTCFPRTQQRLINLFQLAKEEVTANKYETVDRHIDACISAIRQRNQLSHDAGPSTSQQTSQLIMLQNAGKSNTALLQTSGAANYSPSSSAKLLEARASEIFSPSLVKKVIKKRLKTSKHSFKSVNELCEAILAYEESKRKSRDSEKSKRDVNEALLCKVCMDEQMNIVFEPCGHLSTCMDCSKPLNKCPMCRTIITNKRKIYMS